MKPIKFGAVLLCIGAGLFLSACDQLPNPLSSAEKAQPSEAKPMLAVIDMVAVAKALGRDEVVKQQVQTAGRQLQQQLSEFSTGLQTKLREEQAKLGDDPSAEQRQQLQKMLVDAQRQIQQSQTLARQKATQFQNQLGAKFRDEVRPLAAQIAQAKGALSIVATNSVLWFDASVDITGEVIDAMRAKGLNSGAPVIAPSESADTPVPLKQ